MSTSPTSGSPSSSAAPRPTPTGWSARSTTWRPSRSAATPWTGAPTATRSAACCTSAWRAGPPFRRATEAETLWAHMQEEPASLRGHPTLDPVLRKALAKDREDRYRSCAELIDAAARALGLERRSGPGARRCPRGAATAGCSWPAACCWPWRRWRRFWRPWAETTRGGRRRRPTGWQRSGPPTPSWRPSPRSQTAPSSLAVGEGAVWALSLQDRTVTRIDLDTKKAGAPVTLRDVPIDIATGAGAVWVRQGDGLSRIDPRTSRITRTIALPAGEYAGDLAFLNWGFAQVAVGAGAVWAINPDRTVSRIDPASGRRVATIDVDAATIAAGREGVWFIGGEDTLAVTPIDPRTNRVGRSIRLGAQNLSAVAVGGGLRVGLGGGRRARLAHRARAAAGLEDDRRGRGRDLPRLRRRGHLDRELPRRHGVAHRREDRRRGRHARRRRTGPGGRRGVGMGEHRGGDLGGRAPRDVRRAARWCGRARRADHVGPAAPGRPGRTGAPSWRTRSGWCSSSATSGPGSSPSAIAPATTRPRRRGSSTAARAPRTRTPTRARRSWWR